MRILMTAPFGWKNERVSMKNRLYMVFSDEGDDGSGRVT